MKKKFSVRISKSSTSIYTDDKKILNFLAKSDDKSQTIKEILSKFVSGELITKTEFLKQEELLTERITKMKAETRYINVKTKIALSHDLHVSPEDIVKVMNGEKTIDEVIPSTESEIEENKLNYQREMALAYFDVRNHQFVAGTSILFCRLCKKEHEAYTTGIGDFAIRHIAGYHSQELKK